MRIAVAADERTGVADAVVEQLRARGHEPLAHGALSDAERRLGVGVRGRRPRRRRRPCGAGHRLLLDRHGRVDRRQQGPRRARRLCADAATAAGARKWNDANVLALSLSTTSPALLEEILDAWFDAQPSPDADDRANTSHLEEIEG